MKRIFVLILMTAILLSLASCGGKTEPTGNNSTDNTQPTEPAKTGESVAVVTKDSRANGDGS
ncbi:MAG: hypothetical protein IJ713_07770 [Oscillibacter sp.]|nr:hypothetical protein [Oscillibacter sp.]